MLTRATRCDYNVLPADIVGITCERIVNLKDISASFVAKYILGMTDKKVTLDTLSSLSVGGWPLLVTKCGILRDIAQ